MKYSGIFLAAVAVSGLVAPWTEASATVHKKRHHNHAQARPDANAELRNEVESLKSEVSGLHQELEAQRQQASATQSQLADTQSQFNTMHNQIATSSIVSQAEVQSQIHSAIETEHHKDHVDYKGIHITPGGFLELAGIYRDHDLVADMASNFNAIPYGNSRVGQAEEGRFSARQSRLSMLAEGNVSEHTKLAMYGEFDFLGAAQTANSNESNSYTPRIRNIYMTIDHVSSDSGIHFLAGQNWSLVTLNSKGISPRNEVTPPQIDAQYIPGFAWARQPQIRVAADFMNHKLWAAVSVENPQTTVFTTGATGGTATSASGAASLPSTLIYNAAAGSGFNSANTLSLNHIPDVVGKLAFEDNIAGHQLHIEAFGLFRSFYSQVNGVNQNVSGSGAGGSITLQVVPKVLDVQFSGMFGKGIGRYGSAGLPDVTFDASGNIKPIDETMLLAGATLHATKMLDIYGFAGEERDQANYTGTTTSTAYGYGNPLYINAYCTTLGATNCVGNTQSVKQATVGFWQKLYQGSFGRAQVGIQYSYTERQSFVGVGGAPDGKENMGFLSFRYYPF